MQTVTHILWLGVWLLIVPFLGIPGVWKDRLFILTSLLVLGFALRTYYGRKAAISEKASSETGTVSA